MVKIPLPSAAFGEPARRVLAPISSFHGTGLSSAGMSTAVLAHAVTSDAAAFLLADLPGLVPRGAPV